MYELYSREWRHHDECNYGGPDHNCPQCEVLNNLVDESREFIEEITKQLYGKEHLNLEMLENCLEEVCAYFDINFSKIAGDTKLQIERSRKIADIRTEATLDAWKHFNHAYLNNLPEAS